MIDRFTRFIKKHALFEPRDKILLGVSGGVDSMAMASLFRQAGYVFGIGHCNFSLRGEASDADEQLVARTAEKYKVPFHSETFDTKKYAERHKISIEMAARRLRYGFFEDICKKRGYRFIAAAHHKGDVIETIIFNLARGSGISGVRGILPKRDKIIRPMLFADREMILAYARENLVEWREDASNEATEFQRNHIRHRIIPELFKINPSLFQTLEKTTRRLQAAEYFYHAYLDQAARNAVSKDGKDLYIRKSALADLPFADIFLLETLDPYGFNLDQCENMIDGMGQTGAIFESETHTMNIDRDFLIVSPAERIPAETEFFPEEKEASYGDQRFAIATYEAKNYAIKADPSIAALDYDKLRFPLKFRAWKPGDRFVPLGMKNKKKLSDFMIDEKIPVNLKKRAAVLVSGDDIVWLAGLRVDDRFKITQRTTKTLEIALKKDDKPV